MSYNKNDRGGWSQVASSDKSSDNRGLKDLKRDYYVHRTILIAVEVSAIVLLVVLFLSLGANSVMDFVKVFILIAFIVFSGWLYVLDSFKYKKLIVEYLIKEFKGDLQRKEEGPTGLSLALLRETRLWGNLDDRDGSLFHRQYTHDIDDEDQFSSKKYPFRFFEFKLTLTKGSGRNSSTKVLFHGPVVKVKLPSKVDGLIVKTKDNQAQKLDALWDEVTSESQNLIRKSPFAMFVNGDNLFIFFENEHDLFDPSFLKGASEERIAEDTNYIRAMYQIGKLVSEKSSGS